MTFRLNNFVAREFFKPAGVGGGGRVGGSKTTQPQVDIEAINDRIQAGDKDALKELDKLGINYTLTQDSSGGYTVEYKYGDKNYTVRYYAPPSSTPSITQKEEYFFQDSSISKYLYLQRYDTLYDSTNAAFKGKLNSLAENPVNETEEPEAADTSTPVPDEAEDVSQTSPDTTEETTPTEEKDYEFDYSSAGVDEEADATGFYDEDLIPEEKKIQMLFGTQGNVDAGGWDNLFAELEKMKPQLLDYIKTQVEARGLTFNQDEAEKYLETYITDAVEHIPQDGKSILIKFGQSNLPENPTVEDLVNYIKAQIDKRMGIYEDREYGVEHIFTLSNQTAFSTKREDRYIATDEYLLDTADYFLTEEEKEMKFVLKVTSSDQSSYTIKDKQKLYGYIDTYAEHMEKVLKYDYPSLSDNQIASIISDAKNQVKYSDLPEPDSRGLYSIDDTLAKLEELCLEYAEEYNK